MPTDPRQWPPRWQCLALLLLIAASYATSLHGWFCGDDAVTLLDASAVLHHPMEGFGPGTFGRFRPLRLFSVAAVYVFAGTKFVVPYHLLSLAIHIVNTLLTYRLLKRLIGTDGDALVRFIPFAATAIFAVHAAGSEAVTYLSPIGMLFSTTGTLICCLAVRNLAEKPQRKVLSLLQLAAGMLIAIGGGYAMPTLLVVLLCALWPRHDSPRLLPKNMGLAALVVVPLTVLYAVIEKLLIVHDFEKQARFDPLFMLGQLFDNVARLCLPSTFVNEPITYALLAAATFAILLLPPLRKRFLQPRTWLFLAITIACLLPYAPSALGNRDRFCYLPAPFFAAFWLLLAAVLFRYLTPAAIAAFVIVLAVNVAGMQVRVGNTNRCGDALRDFIARMDALRHSAPEQHLRVFMTTPDLEQALFMLRLTGVVSGQDQAILGMPLSPWPPPGETWVLASYRKRHRFEITILSTPK